MPSLKALRKRIATVRSTQQITKAMKMVAAAKLRRAQEAAERARPYAAKLSEMFTAVAAGVEPEAHPLLARRPEQRIDLLVLTSDRGLCGGYNANLLRFAEGLVRQRAVAETAIVVVGRKGLEDSRPPSTTSSSRSAPLSWRASCPATSRRSSPRPSSRRSRASRARA